MNVGDRFYWSKAVGQTQEVEVVSISRKPAANSERPLEEHLEAVVIVRLLDGINAGTYAVADPGTLSPVISPSEPE